MKNSVLVFVVCGALALAMGPRPRYLEELRIGGGYGEFVNGGADLDASGNIATDGDLRCDTAAVLGGAISCGQDGSVRGMIAASQGAANAPGCLRLSSTSGTPYYVFASDSGEGLRISGNLPESDDAGHWLRAQTVADLSAPPAIGSSVPNTGRFASLTGDGELRVMGPAIIGATGQTPEAKLNLRSGDSGYNSARDPRVSEGALIENDGDAVLEIQSAATNTCQIWFGDGQSEAAGRVRYTHTGDSMDFYAGGVARLTLTGDGDVEATGDFTCKGGDVTAGLTGTTRGILAAAPGAGGTVPGVIKMYSPGGTAHYLFVEDDGTLKVHNTLPASNGDGQEVGEQYRSSIISIPADDTTPSVGGGRLFKISTQWTSGHDITMFDDGAAGQTITLIGNDADCTVVDGGHLYLSGNWTGSSGKTLTLVFDGADWFETGRGNN